LKQTIRIPTCPRHVQRDPILYNSIKVEPDKAYFLYIGDIKNHGLNAFLIPYLERIYGRPVECIALVPDVLAYYPYTNLAVLNKESYHYHAGKGMLVNCRPTAGDFAQQVSASLLAQELLDNILRQQDLVYIHTFESRPEMTLPDGESVKLLGPDPTVAHRFNNKIVQYQMACEVGIPVPEGLCCNCLEEALETAQQFFRSGEEVFVSESYSAAGSNSTFACCCEEIRQRFIETDQPYLVTRRIPHSYDPTVLAIVANEQEVYVASVADQRMEENRFRGSTFPTVLKEEVVEQIKEYTRLVGRYMGSQGYRGMFGCDYIVNDNGQVYFVEVNARKQGTTLESILTMLHSLPGHPSLSEIEFCAITRERLPQGLTEMHSMEADICWGTYNVKSMQDIRVVQKLPYFQSEAKIFGLVSQAKVASSMAIVEDHLGPGVYQRAGGFVGRCISVGKTFAQMYRQLEKRETQVKASFRPWHHLG
jgi:hypothetical protein